MIKLNVRFRQYCSSAQLTVLVAALVFWQPAVASLLQKWQEGLAGAKLTHYSGSLVTSNSALTVIDFCGNGRYRYYKEGSWLVPGMAGGASNNTITGRWEVRKSLNGVVLWYHTDRGQTGTFPLFLQNNGRVNIGGVAYAVQKNGASC